MIQETQNPLGYKRHPFVWLVEAADDICYNIIDMEDAHRLGIVNTSDCKNLFYDLIKSIEIDTKKIDQKLSVITDSNEQISYLRAKVINSLINKSIEIFKDNAVDLLEGILLVLCLAFTKKKMMPSKDREFSVEKIYNHKAVVEIENAGYNVMYELLNHFIPSAVLAPSERKGYDKRLFS